MNSMHKIVTAAALGGALLGSFAAAGCGGSAITPQLRDARATMDEARQSSAATLKPEGLLVAQRSLERAEAQSDGSRSEAHFAYVAERQTRIAMAEARQLELEQNMEADRERYRTELETLARSRGEALEESQRTLDQQRGTLEEQQRAMQQTQEQLAAEQAARQQAEQRAEQAMARLRELAAVRQSGGETVITLSGEVIFETDSANLRDTARERLLAVADALRSEPNQMAVVEGHTDSRGSDEYNQRLSQRRAEAVRDYLIGEGVPAARMQAVGRGEESPVSSNDSAEGRAGNRRVEIHLRPIPGAPQTPTAMPDAMPQQR